ncbi:MAG TPA: protein kinase [Gemmatimonadaceae bacterium]|nr:protein kinase [Gemmatimonadaceae bacterium]
MPELPDQLTAALADRYRIERELGVGGMAVVYLAHDIRHNRQIALKVIKPGLAAAVGAQRFLREIQVTANLQHPHILALYDSGVADGVLYYVMPLVQGQSLRERLTREERLTVEETIRIVTQVAGALDFAHRQGVIHRDIKPENILFHDGEALLADFGIALAMGNAGDGRITETGLSIGSPLYMSPEQAMGDRDVDARSDIFSLAAVTYEMLGGEPPFNGPTVQAIIAKLATQRPTSLRPVRDDVTPAMDAAIMRGLATSPEDRFATAREFADALTKSAPPQKSKTNQMVAGALLVAAVAAALVVFRTLPSTAGGARADSAAEAAGAHIRSIAVLPLDNYSGDSTQEYFVEGMTDELTSDLARISSLRVISRGSASQFAGKNRPSTPDIAKALNVDAIVEGSVVRVGDKVRITAQLINARLDQYIWSDKFERSSGDVFVLQADLASAIASAINVALSPVEQSRLASAKNVNPEAHDAYLKGRYFFNRPSDDNLQSAIEQFEIAVKLDPSFAPAYSGLSDAYLWAGYNEGRMTATAARPKAREAALKAVRLDSTSAEGHASLATYKLFYEYDWAGCEREFRKAISLNPNYAFAHDQFGMALAFTGRFDESMAEGRRAAELDPLSPQILIDATLAFLFNKNFDGARELAIRAKQLDPSYFFPVMIEGWIELDSKNPRDAIPFLKKSAGMGAPPFVTAYLAYARGASGDRTGALAELDALKKMAGRAPVLPFNLAMVYLGLGDKARAIDNLEKALAADSQMLAWLGQDSIFDSLRGEPRFIALLERLNFVKRNASA